VKKEQFCFRDQCYYIGNQKHQKYPEIFSQNFLPLKNKHVLYVVTFY
jgi:hypothetical protein